VPAHKNLSLCVMSNDRKDAEVLPDTVIEQITPSYKNWHSSIRVTELVTLRYTTQKNLKNSK